MRTIAGLFLAAAVAGAQGPTVRDSAGIRIVEHRTIKTTRQAFTIGATPIREFGGIKTDPNEELDAKNPFTDLHRLSDGRYVVSDYAWIKQFDANGRYVRTIGRSGNGPGEFHQLRETCVATGDTIVAIGYGDRRVSVFDSAGRHVRSFSAPGYSSANACFSDGSLIVHSNRRVNPDTKMPANLAASLDVIEDLERVLPSGTSAGVIAKGYAEVLGGAGTVTSASVRNRLMVVGDGRTAEFRIHSADGKLTQIVRWADPLELFTDPQRQSSSQPMRGGPPLPPRPHLDNIPAYSRLLIDDAGRVWMQDYFTTPDRGWTLFAANGALLGRIRKPAIAEASAMGVEVASVDSDRVVLVWRDEADGAVHVAFHALTRAQ